MKTRTGGFPIGFRRGWSDWQKDTAGMIGWAKENRLEVVDVGRGAPEVGRSIIDAGLRIGSVDLLEWEGMISPDPAKRADAVAKNAEYIKTCASTMGALNYFVVMLPEDKTRSRLENFGYMVESYSQLD